MYQKNKEPIGNETKILSVRYDPTDSRIAIGSDDGYLRVVKSRKLDLEHVYLDLTEEKITPCTSVRWHPKQPNLLVSTYTSGSVTLWDTESGSVLQKFREPQLNISGCDVNATGEKLVTCGYDTVVRVYDLNSGSTLPTIQKGIKIPSHNNRIYAAKFLGDDPNSVITAGWDHKLLFWDLRVNQSVGFIHGPLICGDSLDYKNGVILTGSWRN